MPERFEDAIKALRHVARGNGVVMRIADRIERAHMREVACALAQGDGSQEPQETNETAGDAE